MPRRVPALLMLASLCLAGHTDAGVAAQAQVQARAADLIVQHGHIKTPGGWAEALAIRGGVIVAVADDQAVLSFRGAKTRLIDVQGATVLPGLHDLHVHPIFAGITEHQCKIPQGLPLTQVQQQIKACAARAAPDAWIAGGQWDASALGRVPDRAALDAVSGHHPALLDDTSGHSSWANSRALALAGITRASVNPAGGIIERDPAGEPTGVLREAAIELVRSHIPKPTAPAVRAALQWATHQMLSFGITSFTEASVGFVAGAETELKAYAQLADAGVLKQRATLCLTWAADSPAADAAILARNLYARARVAPDCVKIFLDGVPTDGHTAAMLQPYVGTLEGRDDEAARQGMLLVKQDVLNAVVTRFDGMGLTVKFHAAGDAAVRAGLSAIAAARASNGFNGLMHNVGHCTFVSPQDIARARAIAATFEVSPYLWSPSPISEDIAAAVGPVVIQRVWPVRDMIDSGALVVAGSDWSVVPSVNPWIGIETLVTREIPGGGERSFGKSEAISIGEAMDLFTLNAARQEHMAQRVGRIEAGMLADIIVVDQDPYGVPPARVHDTRVRMTFIGGEKVYDSHAK